MHMQIKEMPVIQYMLMHTEAFRDFMYKTKLTISIFFLLELFYSILN